MKRFLSIAVVFLVLVFVGAAWAAADKPAKPVFQQCPKTKMTESCLDCHVKGTFRIKETRPDAHLSYPRPNMKIMGWDSVQYGYFLLSNIDDDAIKEFFDYLAEHKITKAVIEIQSPGGSLFAAQRIISLIEQWRASGGIIETRVTGFAASAGFLIFAAGDLGKRFVCSEAALMWHELMTFKMFSIETPSDQEEQSRVLRQLQDVRNEWLATRGNLTKEEIDAKIKKKEFWMSGEQAMKFGFADGFMGKK